jgi:LysR family carnitine catabolism transcriptional activator
MNVNLTKIRCLIAVGETLSFRAASERLNLSQPAVSNHIRDLELSLGITLFKRTTRNVVLTPDGESFLIRSRSAIAALDDAMRDIREQRAVRSGRVNFGCVPSMARLFVPAALSRFSKRYPNVKIQLFDELADRLFKRTLDYEIDFMIGPAAPSRLGLDFTHLMDDRYVAIVPAGHVLADRRSVRLADLSGHPFILITTPSIVRTVLEQAFAQSGQELDPAYSAANPSTIGAMIKAGLGVTILPNLVVPAMVRSGLRSVPVVRPRIVRKIGILRRAKEPLAPAAQALAATFGDVIRSPMGDISQSGQRVDR